MKVSHVSIMKDQRMLPELRAIAAAGFEMIAAAAGIVVMGLAVVGGKMWVPAGIPIVCD